MQSLGKILEMNQQKICSGSHVSQPMSSQKTMSFTSSDANSQSKRIDLMFSRFAAFYGHLWRSQLQRRNDFYVANRTPVTRKLEVMTVQLKQCKDILNKQ